MGEAARRSMTGLAAVVAVALVASAPAARADPPRSDLGMTIFLQRQASREATAYSAVRTAVEDGRRPTADLEAARRSLKAAQVALYDQVDQTRRGNEAMFGGLRKQNARRLKEQVILVRAEEAELTLLADSDRPNAEARLALGRQVLDGYRQNALRLADQPHTAPRPKLPILPPRS